MREIKFRAWTEDLHGKGMTYGWGCYTDDNSKQWLITDGDRIRATELMQYTGLKDKNGKEIYEGDILQHSNDKDWRFPMVWREKSTEPFSLSYYDESEDFEVVGNIWETPELISKEV